MTSPSGATYAIVSYASGCSVPVNNIVERRLFQIEEPDRPATKQRLASSGVAMLGEGAFPTMGVPPVSSHAYVAEIKLQATDESLGRESEPELLNGRDCPLHAYAEASVVRLLKVPNHAAAIALLTEARDHGLPEKSAQFESL